MKYDNSFSDPTVKAYAINYLRMQLATITAGLACTMASWLFSAGYIVEYIVGGSWFYQFIILLFAWIGGFLTYRVFAFMANYSLKLTIENVEFMSEQRILWNVATIAVLTPLLIVRWLIISLS